MEARSSIAPEKLHAIGCITMNWGACEAATGLLFAAVTRIPPAVARALIHEMGDVSLVNRMRDVATVKARPTEEIEELEFFSKYHDRCRVNRNQVVHCWLTYDDDLDVDVIRMIRARGPILKFDPINDDLGSGLIGAARR